MPSVIKHSYMRGGVRVGRGGGRVAAGAGGRGLKAGGKSSRNLASRAGAHINYIAFRSGEDREEKGPREFHTADRDNVNMHDVKRMVREELKPNDVVHKLIISPGDNRVDINEYTREIMRELGNAKGQELQYAFVVHDNTDHKHAHVVLLGRDADGGLVRIDKMDHMRMRAFGDRYLEREHGIERHLDKDMERFARERGLNIMFDAERGPKFYEMLYAADESKRGRDASFQHELYDKMNKDIMKMLDQMQSESYSTYMGFSTYQLVGRNVELQQLMQNAHDIQNWKEIGENNPELADIAKQKVEELQAAQTELREDIGQKTKPWWTVDALDKIYNDLNQERKEIFDLLNPKTPEKEQEKQPKDIDKPEQNREEPGKEPEQEVNEPTREEPALDDLVGMHPANEDKDPEQELADRFGEKGDREVSIDDMIFGDRGTERQGPEVELGEMSEPSSADEAQEVHDLAEAAGVEMVDMGGDDSEGEDREREDDSHKHGGFE